MKGSLKGSKKGLQRPFKALKRLLKGIQKALSRSFKGLVKPFFRLLGLRCLEALLILVTALD